MRTSESKSFLIVPAVREAWYEKAGQSQASAVILDLEDSVKDADKDVARFCVKRGFLGLQSVVTTGIRINALDTFTGLDDVRFLLDNQVFPDWIIIPKVTDHGEVGLAKRLWGRYGNGRTRFMSLIESSAAVSNIDSISHASDGLMFGAADFALERGLRPDPVIFQFARQMVVTHAQKFNIPAIDSPTFELDSPAELCDECRLSQLMGFSGKLAISKTQVSHINKGFSYSNEDREWAHHVLLGNDQLAATVRRGSQMVGPPILATAKRILDSEWLPAADT